MYERLKDLSTKLQDLLTVDGGIYVDCMCVAFIVRLLAPLRGYPALNAAEAGLWAATIATYGYSNRNKQS